LLIQNVGLGPAYFVNLNTKPSDYEYSEGKSISSVHPFQDDLKFLAPNQRKYFNLGALNLIKPKLREKDIEILAKYKDGSGKNHEDLSIICLALMESEYSLIDISISLGRI
jgi:hypothetical protein